MVSYVFSFATFLLFNQNAGGECNEEGVVSYSSEINGSGFAICLHPDV